MDENINPASDQTAQTTTEDEGKSAEDISDTKLDQCKVPEDAITNPLDCSGDSTMSHDIDSGNSVIGTEKATTSNTDNSELSSVQEKASNIPKHLKYDIDPSSEDLELKWDEDDDNVIDEDTPGLIENLELDIIEDKAGKDAGDDMDGTARNINDNHPITDPVLLDNKITDLEINEVVTEKAVPSDVNVSEKMEIDVSDVVDESCTSLVAPSSTTENTETTKTQESMKIKLSTPESVYNEESSEKNSIIKVSNNANENKTTVMSEVMENVLIEDKTSESPDKPETLQLRDIPEEITVDSTNLHEEPTQTTVDSTDLHKEPTQTSVDSTDLHEEPTQTIVYSTDLLKEPTRTTVDSTDLHEEPTRTTVDSTDLHEEPTQIAIELPAISIFDDSATIATDIPLIEIKAKAINELALIEPVAEITKEADFTDLHVIVKLETSDILENTETQDTITEAKQVESIEDFIANMPVLSEDSRTDEMFSKDDVPESPEDKFSVLSPTERDFNEKQETSMETDVEMSDKQMSELEDVLQENQEITVKDEPITAIETPDETVFLPEVDQVKAEVSEMPATSQAEDMVPDDDDFVSMTDSLGLLSESTRMIEEEDEPDDDNDDDGDDEEDADDDQDDADDESNLRQPDLSEDSNQITAEQSEDSNAPVSETDISKGQESYENTSDGFVVKPDDVKETIETPATDKVLEIGVIAMVHPESAEDSKDEEKSMDVDEEGDVARRDQKTPEKQIIASKETAVSPDRPDIPDELVTAVAEEAVDGELENEVEPKETDLQDTKNNNEPILETATEEAKVSEVIEDKEQSGEVPMVESEESKPLSVPEQLSSVDNIIDLEESSEDELQETQKDSPPPLPIEDKTDPTSGTLTSVNIPAGIDIMSAGSGASSIVSDQGEVVVQGLPKPQPVKKTRLNTSEISIKTANTTAEPLVIPETKIEDLKAQEKPTEKFGLEIFSLDSDDEDSNDAFENRVKSPSPIRRLSSRCVNPLCPNDNEEVKRFPADAMVLRYYEVKRRRAIVCECCAEFVSARAWQLMEGFKSLAPLLSLDISKPVLELVEILDSDSDGEGDKGQGGELETGGGPGLQADRLLELEEQLEEIINKTWIDCSLSERLIEAKEDIEGQLDFLEKKRMEVEAMFESCQLANDNLRSDLYSCFAPTTKHLPALEIYDTPDRQFTGVVQETEQQEQEIRRSKRPRPPMIEAPAAYAPAAKRQAIPLGYKDNQESKDDDSTDIRVVKLSAEAAPASLPPAGVLTKPPLKAGDLVLARREASGTWLRATVLEVMPKGTSQFTTCRVRFENKSKLVVTLTARQLAYSDPANVRLVIGTRMIALFIDTANTLKRRMFYSGIIAEMPNPVNNYRYLIFFDIGYAQYVTHADSRVVCECSRLVWEEVQPLSREFVRQYLVNYPERPMVRLHAGQSLKTEWNGKWWVSKVLQVDASLVQVHFEADNRTEWIYRGSTRLAPLYLELQAAERPRPRHSTANKRNQQNMPYVEYTRSDEAADLAQKTEEQIKLHNEELRRQRAVAKKSTAAPLQPHSVTYPQPLDSVMSRVVYYTPKAAVKPYKMATHTCTERCRRTDVLPLKELRTYNPLARPLLSGWERQIVRYKGRKEVMYRAPCGRRLRTMPELHRYLTATQSEMGVDLFDFNSMTHCLAEFLLNRCRVTKKDLSHGKENVPVPCVNYYDNSLPEMCLYNTERTPTAGVPLNLDGAFLCGCDCVDDCQDKSKCQCWQLTIEGARTIGMDEDEVGYVYKRLPEPVPTGIYECNSRCKCKQTCLNRVAQHPLQLKLQVFKTQNRGWGIRALNDVPKGAFLCVYAGNLLTDATANLDGLNEGDEYLAELDYIEVVEQMKEGFEEDVPAKDKMLDKKEGSSGNEEEESSSSEEEERPSKNEDADHDFKPDYIPMTAPFKKSLRKREKKKKEEIKEEPAENKIRSEDDCITISDDEEVKEPSNFTAQAGMADGDLSPRTKSVRSHFGKDEACYIMDAKVQGNIGRYLNHSCMPNVFVQNVFVDTHDLRFPWVAFFALSHVRAGTELTWNYNYDVGSVPGKVLKCFCGAPNCRGRLL